MGLVFCLRILSVPKPIFRFTLSRGYIKAAWGPGDEVTRDRKREGMKGCRAREVQLPGTVGEHQPCGRLVLATFSSHLSGPYCGHCPRTGPLASTRTRGVRTSFSCPARSWEEFCLPNDSEKQTSTGMLRIRAAPPQNQIDAIPFTSDVGVQFLAPGRLGQLSVPSGQGETTFPWSLLHPISPLGPPK